MAKLALYAASNYLGTPHQLKGCVNDVLNVRAAAQRAGFRTVGVLLGGAMSTVAWESALLAVAASAKPGDIVLHMHSHHGAQIADPAEADGLAEVWCPDDFDWSPERMITDKWMAELIDGLPRGVLWVDWADCCHAGDSVRTYRSQGERPRFIPNPDLSLAERSMVSRPMVVSSGDRRGILLAACRSDQTAADTVLGGQPQGAFTGMMLSAGAFDGLDLTYAELLDDATRMLRLRGYSQTPELDGPVGAEELVQFTEPNSAKWWEYPLYQMLGGVK